MSQTRTRFVAAVALVGALCAGAAQATDVHWTIGINAPLGYGGSVGTVFSNDRAAPVYVATAPVVYAPPPGVYLPAPAYYPAHPVYVPRRVVAPMPVYAPVWVGGRWVGAHHGYRHPHWAQPHRGHRGTPVHAPQGGHGHRYPG